ncbi:MAG: bifunctional DNA-binding transcriptional regulator/O6-methylguanine-DNA methyltransferase Ada [Acidobacteriia bacterium]|nr:bifunctional DNA-binding transcriptional regulator/O6-methylguanine-DNA methyltransferase Ada [Terriglobia bacterium]
MLHQESKSQPSRVSSEDLRWQAVLNRDSRSDRAFVFAVRSTGIYCRPSCPARRPQRAQVVFFPEPNAAERSGFRPCRRCHPRDGVDRDPQAELVCRVCAIIDSGSDETLTLDALSTQVGLSPHHLQRTFKRLMGITPRQYAEARRLKNFKAHLRNGRNVTTALYEAGYGSSSRLYEKTGPHLGMTPTAYRKGGEGMMIRYTVNNSPLGRLLVAATDRGICFLSLGDADRPLETVLREEYPSAEIRREESGLGQWVNSIVKHLQGNQPQLKLPLDVQATAFQWEVWHKLQSIPYGQTRSYSDIARSLGRPRAARAVARACATNRVPIVIPCHRVVREDGNPGGYRWGINRKETLLSMERSNSASLRKAAGS